MRLIKAILRQGVDLIFLAVTLGIFISYLIKPWHDAALWLGGCALYVMGNIWSKARLSIWLEDNNLTNNNK